MTWVVYISNKTSLKITYQIRYSRTTDFPVKRSENLHNFIPRPSTPSPALIQRTRQGLVQSPTSDRLGT